MTSIDLDHDLIDDEAPPKVVRLTVAEAREVFDEKARTLLGISGDGFLRRLDAGEYDAIEEDETGRKVVRLMVALPLGSVEPGATRVSLAPHQQA